MIDSAMVPTIGAGIAMLSGVNWISFSFSSCAGSCPASFIFSATIGLLAAFSRIGRRFSRLLSLAYTASTAAGMSLILLSYLAIMIYMNLLKFGTKVR